MKFSIKDFFSKCDQIRSLKKSLMVNFIFCAMSGTLQEEKRLKLVKKTAYTYIVGSLTLIHCNVF